MCKLFIDWENEIREYCLANGLNFEKAKNAGKCWGKDVLMLQHIDPEKGGKGLADETPAPVTLVIHRDGNLLRFEQTEFTRVFLS